MRSMIFILSDSQEKGIKAMNINDLLKLVDVRWHDEFLQYINTGKASAEFCTYLDNDVNAQKAVDAVINAQFEALQQFRSGFRPTRSKVDANEIRKTLTRLRSEKTLKAVPGHPATKDIDQAAREIEKVTASAASKMSGNRKQGFNKINVELEVLLRALERVADAHDKSLKSKKKSGIKSILKELIPT